MPESTTKKTATDNAKEAARSATAVVNVCLPGVVTAYDKTTQSASVHIVPCFRRKDPLTKTVEPYQPPDIHGVPVAFPGAGDFSVTWPLAVGDTGMIFFSDRSMDEWKSVGGTDSEPQDLRRHNLTDAIFVPGLRSFAEAVPADGVDDDAMVLGAPEIKLGSSAASDFVALASLVRTELDAIWTAFDGHSHTYIPGTLAVQLTTGNPSGGPSGPVESAKVKSE